MPAKLAKLQKKKLPYYDIIHTIKYKHKISPPPLLDTLSSNAIENTKPLNKIFITEESQANISRSETIVSIEPSTSEAGLNSIYTNPKTILKPKNKISPSDILSHMTTQHKEIL
uniref:Uncharacterized protein n=1 Tax=Schizaphis graminum TaxID=13262 RepID=A0A2S2NEP9_SCHGA